MFLGVLLVVAILNLSPCVASFKEISNEQV